MTHKRERVQLEQDLALNLNLLKSINNETEETKKTLEWLTVQQSSLEVEIQQIRAILAPINHVPNEILCNIFELATCPNDLNPSEVKKAGRCRANILLVCKEWYHLTTNAGFLWKVLLVTGPPTTTIRSTKTWLQSRRTSLEAQVSRCKGALLDIVVDISEMQDVQYSIQKEIWRLLPAFTEDFDEWHSSIPFQNFPEKWYTRLYEELLGVIIGEKGSRMKRWRSLRLALPRYSHLDPAIWCLFIGATPNLTSLELEGSTTELLNSPNYSAAFPYLNAVTDLTVFDDFNLNAVPCCNHIRKLSLILSDIQVNWYTLPSISRFLPLEELCIHYMERYEECDVLVPRIHIPSLPLLTLCGPVLRPIMDALAIERISKLVIREDYFPFETLGFDLLSNAEWIEVALTFEHDGNERGNFVADVVTRAINAWYIEFSYKERRLAFIREKGGSGQLAEWKAVCTMKADSIETCAF